MWKAIGEGLGKFVIEVIRILTIAIVVVLLIGLMFYGPRTKCPVCKPIPCERCGGDGWVTLGEAFFRPR